MAGERALPGLGLLGFWSLGSNGYKDQLDSNLRLLSALVQPYVLSSVAAVPGGPANGDIHRLTVAPNLNDIAVRDNGSWVYLTPTEGWVVYDRNADQRLLFNGTAWVNLANNATLNGAAAPTAGIGVNGDFYLETTNTRLYGPKAGGAWGGFVSLRGSDFPALAIITTAVGITLTNTHFAGNRLINVTSGIAVNLVLNTGLTGVEPLLVEQNGVGQVTISGTATLRGRAGLKTAGQYGVITIIPKGSDVYTIGGDSTT